METIIVFNEMYIVLKTHFRQYC